MSEEGLENRCGTGVSAPRTDQKDSGVLCCNAFNFAVRFSTIDQPLANRSSDYDRVNNATVMRQRMRQSRIPYCSTPIVMLF